MRMFDLWQNFKHTDINNQSLNLNDGDKQKNKNQVKKKHY